MIPNVTNQYRQNSFKSLHSMSVNVPSVYNFSDGGSSDQPLLRGLLGVQSISTSLAKAETTYYHHDYIGESKLPREVLRALSIAPVWQLPEGALSRGKQIVIQSSRAVTPPHVDTISGTQRVLTPGGDVAKLWLISRPLTESTPLPPDLDGQGRRLRPFCMFEYAFIVRPGQEIWIPRMWPHMVFTPRVRLEEPCSMPLLMLSCCFVCRHVSGTGNRLHFVGRRT
jgi:hypothetical protein